MQQMEMALAHKNMADGKVSRECEVEVAQNSESSLDGPDRRHTAKYLSSFTVTESTAATPFHGHRIKIQVSPISVFVLVS